MSRIDTQALKRITSTLLSYAGVAIFFWAIYPYKWTRRLVWKLRLEKAKGDARQRAADENKAMYVIQDRLRFKVRSRYEARRIDTRIHRNLKKKHKSYVRWDYRNGLVFVAYPDGRTETIDATPKTTRKKEETKVKDHKEEEKGDEQ